MTNTLDPTTDTDFADLLLGDNRVLWVGHDAPVPGCIVDDSILKGYNDYRLPADMAGQFDVVALLEPNIGQTSAWSMIVDEALRALRTRGTLILRFHPGESLSTHELMALIEARSVGGASLIKFQKTPENIRIMALEIEQPERTAAVTGISFALVTDGKQPERVRRFVNSVRGVRGLASTPYEILVTGPAGCIDHVVSPTLNDVRLVLQPDEFSSVGWITRKKNLLVGAARYDVTLVAHDRYWLAPDFLEELAVFGADSDIVIPRQETRDGVRYPDWVAVPNEIRLSPIIELDPATATNTLYVNGGIVLARTEAIRQLGWNELLFWADGEDVELTTRMRAKGMVPRYCRKLRVLTDVTRPDQLSVFERRTPGPINIVDEKAAPGALFGVPMSGVMHGTGVVPLGTTRQKSDVRTDLFECAMKMADNSVGIDNGAMLYVHCEGADAGTWPIEDLFVNAQRVPIGASGHDGNRGWVGYELSTDFVVARHTLRIGVRAVAGFDFDKLTFMVGAQVNNFASTSEIFFDAEYCKLLLRLGWGHLEDWGMWSLSESQTMCVPTAVSYDRPWRLFITCRGNVPKGLPYQVVSVRVPGSDFAAVLQCRDRDETHAIDMPAGLVHANQLPLQFNVLEPASPVLEEGHDPRQLGIGLVGLRADRGAVLLTPKLGPSVGAPADV